MNKILAGFKRDLEIETYFPEIAIFLLNTNKELYYPFKIAEIYLILA